MKLVQVHALDRPELEIYRKFRENAFRADGSFVADSPRVVKLLLDEGVRPVSLLATPQFYENEANFLRRFDIPVGYVAPKAVLESIVGHNLHHNVMMHALRPDETPLEKLGDRIVMLDEISKADNIGAIARSAAALGVGALLVPRRGPHPYARRAVRISTGHIAKLRYHRYDDILSTLGELKRLGYAIFGAEVTPDAVPLGKIDIPQKWVLLLGHEEFGLGDEVLRACDATVRIEMEEGIKSFNVAVAASIMMYAFRMKF
jgi:tRNA G18 (ribose-2'-O)-methylase SpoU